jgi:DNA polymerase-4
MGKRIAYIDMDAFFVAVERRDRPELRGLPVVVGGTGGRGVVCSASYEARRFGVHSGMPSARARQLCPQAVFLPPSSGKYSEASRRAREALERYSPDVDFISVDEGYVDLTGTERLLGPPMALAQRMRADIMASTGCSASIGVADNRLCAKVASKFAKPAGIVEVAPGAEAAFLAPLPLRLLPGAGGKLGERLAGFGVTRIGRLVEVGERFLAGAFGAAGSDFYLKALGGGERGHSLPSYDELPRKSVSHERTFAEDTTDADFLERVLFRLSERCCRTLRDEGLVGRTVTLKVRLADFRTFTRSHTLLSSTDGDVEVFEAARALLRGCELPRVAVRLVGVSVSALSRECQWGLFSRAARLWRLYCSIDAVRDRYGDDSVVAGLVFGDQTTARYAGRGNRNVYRGGDC